MIIDAHSHTWPANSSAGFLYLDGEPDGPLPIDRLVKHILAEPVDYFLISAEPEDLKSSDGLARGNRAVAEAVRLSSGRIFGLCQANPHILEASLADIDLHVANGPFVGIGELCQYVHDYPSDDPRMFPVIERAIDLDVPILEHASAREHTDSLDRLVARFPNARFVVAHAGGMYNWPEGLALAARRENVWLDLSGFTLLRPGFMERALREVGPSRLLFGVDFPLVKAAPLIAALQSLRLPPRDFEAIAGATPPNSSVSPSSRPRPPSAAVLAIAP